MRNLIAAAALSALVPTLASASEPQLTTTERAAAPHFREHGKDERLPVQSFYNNVVHWQLMLSELAGH